MKDGDIIQTPHFVRYSGNCFDLYLATSTSSTTTARFARRRDVSRPDSSFIITLTNGGQ